MKGAGYGSVWISKVGGAEREKETGGENQNQEHEWDEPFRRVDRDHNIDTPRRESFSYCEHPSDACQNCQNPAEDCPDIALHG